MTQDKVKMADEGVGGRSQGGTWGLQPASDPHGAVQREDVDARVDLQSCHREAENGVQPESEG